MKYLVDKGINLHKVGKDCLQSAIMGNHFKIVGYLKEQGINIINQPTILFTIFKGSPEMLDFLVKNGADLDAKIESTI